jgi:hypothetical protein
VCTPTHLISHSEMCVVTRESAQDQVVDFETIGQVVWAGLHRTQQRIIGHWSCFHQRRRHACTGANTVNGNNQALSFAFAHPDSGEVTRADVGDQQDPARRLQRALFSCGQTQRELANTDYGSVSSSGDKDAQIESVGEGVCRQKDRANERDCTALLCKVELYPVSVSRFLPSVRPLLRPSQRSAGPCQSCLHSACDSVPGAPHFARMCSPAAERGS